MGVSGAAIVVAGENGLEGGDTVAVGGLDTAEVGRVPAACGIVAAFADATVVRMLVSLWFFFWKTARGVLGLPVQTGGIAVPNIDVDVLDWFAGVDVYILCLDVEIDTITVLVLLDVLADHFSGNVVWPISDLGGQDA